MMTEPLRRNATLFHGNDCVTQMGGLLEVMSHMQDGDGEVFFEIDQQVTQESARPHVQGGKWFIKQEQVRFTGKGLTECNTLPFAAGNGTGPMAFQMPDAEDIHERVNCARIRRTELDISTHSHVREKRVLLKNHPYFSLASRDEREGFTVHPDVVMQGYSTKIRLFQSGDKADKRSLPGPGRPHHGCQFSRRTGKIHLQIKMIQPLSDINSQGHMSSYS